MKSSWNDPGIFQNILRSHFGLGKPLRCHILDLNLDISIFYPSKISVFLHNALFLILNVQIRIVEKVPMDHTNHFGFRKKKLTVHVHQKIENLGVVPFLRSLQK